MLRFLIAAAFVGCCASPVLANTTSASVTGTGFNFAACGQTDFQVAQSSSVAIGPFSCTFGTPGSWGPANTIYPVVYKGLASASGATGVLRASFEASQTLFVPFRGGSAVAGMDGTITLVGKNPGDAVSTAVHVQVDGFLSGSSSFESYLLASSLSNPTQVWTAVETAIGGSSVPAYVVRNLSLTITGVSGDQFRLYQRLTASASSSGGFGKADFQNTSVLSFAPQSDTLVSGANGYLAAAPVLAAIPEPASVLLAAGGLLVLFGAAQRRRALA